MHPVMTSAACAANVSLQAARSSPRTKLQQGAFAGTHTGMRVGLLALPQPAGTYSAPLQTSNIHPLHQPLHQIPNPFIPPEDQALHPTAVCSNGSRPLALLLLYGSGPAADSAL
jgi:hypothetical protein